MSKLDIITAINLTRKYERKDASHQKIMEETTTLRFKVYPCRVRGYGEGFQPGTVIKLWYTEKYFPEGCLQSLVPYQVRLDNIASFPNLFPPISSTDSFDIKLRYSNLMFLQVNHTHPLSPMKVPTEAYYYPMHPSPQVAVLSSLVNN